MFARFVLFCFLTLQTNLKHFAVAYIKNHFVNYSQRFNIIDELSMDKQNETVRRGSEFLQLLFIFPYLMFFHRFEFHFPLLIYNTHKFCLELMENMLRAAVAAALRVIPTYQGEGEEEGCLGIPLYVIHMYNTISHLASFMQPNPPLLAFIIINYQNRMPSRVDKLARRKKVSRAAQLCVPLGHNRTPLYANELRVQQLKQQQHEQHMEMGCIHLLTCLSCFCCTLGLWPYESCGPKHFGLICFCCCCFQSLLHTFVSCSPTIFGLQIVFAG